MDTTYTMTAAEYKALRDELGMTQEQLARALMVSVSTVSKREQGITPIDNEAALAIRALVEAA